MADYHITHTVVGSMDVSNKSRGTVVWDFDKLKVISELLYVQHHYMSLDTFSMADVADMIETLCTA